jgi:GTP-binding protein
MATNRSREVKIELPRFITSAAKISQCPADIAREVAVIGRSNVGKSSLLGALLKKPDLVRRSRTPGRTQLINYFESKDHDFLADLPGYGYAEMPGKVKAKLDDLIQSYLTERAPLALVLLLVDARRGEEPSALDRAHYEFAREHGRQVLVVVTKIDRIAKSQRKPTYKAIAQHLGVAEEDLLAVSSKEGDGLDALTKRLRAEARA